MHTPQPYRPAAEAEGVGLRWMVQCVRESGPKLRQPHDDVIYRENHIDDTTKVHMLG